MIPHVRGRVALQAHVEVPEGTCEEEYARGGFSGRYAHLYRTHAPVGWSRIEGPLKPRAFDLAKDAATSGDYLADRKVQLENGDVRIAFGRVTQPMGYFYKNADGDELLFVHAGTGTLESDFGPLAYRRGDYLVIPRGTAYRLVPSDHTALLVIETRGELGFPDRGLLGQHALFDPALIEVPTPSAEGMGSPSGLLPGSTLAAHNGEWEVRVKRLGELTHVFYPFCPLDVVGWKGTLSVQRLNVADIRPVMSERYHLPPSAHATFVSDGVIVCTFLPRALETGDPKAMKVPFYHSNIDFDEVLFYHRGQFFSREGIKPGMLTLHPQGIHHGPQPKAVGRTANVTHTDEVAVMLDTRNPLDATPAADAVERADYWKSWSK